MIYNKNKTTYVKRDIEAETNYRPVHRYVIMGFQPQDDASLGGKPSAYPKTFPKDFHPIKTVVGSKK